MLLNYMVVRLYEISSKTGKKMNFWCFKAVLTLVPVVQVKPKMHFLPVFDESQKISKKTLRIGEALKMTFI